MHYVSERLEAAHHDIATFDCGDESLNSWLQSSAAQADVRRTARTWVWVNSHGRVVGYYALAAHRVRREEVPSRAGRGGPREIPAVLLARLGLDTSLRGKGLGSVLVADALNRIVDATQIVGAKLVVVDALHERVAGFYERLGFTRVPDSLLLAFKIADAEAAQRG